MENAKNKRRIGGEGRAPFTPIELLVDVFSWKHHSDKRAYVALHRE